MLAFKFEKTAWLFLRVWGAPRDCFYNNINKNNLQFKQNNFNKNPQKTEHISAVIIRHKKILQFMLDE